MMNSQISLKCPQCTTMVSCAVELQSSDETGMGGARLGNVDESAMLDHIATEHPEEVEPE